MLLVLELGFLMVVVLECERLESRRSPGELPSFLDVLVLGIKKRTIRLDGPVCFACAGLDEHESDHTCDSQQNRCNGF